MQRYRSTYIFLPRSYHKLKNTSFSKQVFICIPILPVYCWSSHHRTGAYISHHSPIGRSCSLRQPGRCLVTWLQARRQMRGVTAAIAWSTFVSKYLSRCSVWDISGAVCSISWNVPAISRFRAAFSTDHTCSIGFKHWPIIHRPPTPTTAPSVNPFQFCQATADSAGVRRH